MVSFSIGPADTTQNLHEQIEEACRLMEEIYESGAYIKITVVRHWSKHNPVISGKTARPSAYRWYLKRELMKLAEMGAEIEISSDHRRVAMGTPDLLHRIDETDFDHTRKKAFLFGPERVELSVQRLEHYTGTKAEQFQRYVLLTNYQMHMDTFRKKFPDCISGGSVQMPAYHQVTADNDGVSIVNIGVGPSNAKNFTDHLAVLRPEVMLMIGHCAGVRNHQEIGDFVLASGYMRADHVLDDALPRSVPVAPSFILNRYLAKVLDDRDIPYRFGAVYTTADRNWELTLERTLSSLRVSRSIAVDMESATVTANGFRYRIPSATLLCVSDKPLHGKPKLPKHAQTFYAATKEQHLDIACEAVTLARQEYPEGLPNSDLRPWMNRYLAVPNMTANKSDPNTENHPREFPSSKVDDCVSVDAQACLAIQVQGFQKIYDRTVAADDISFSLPAGTVGALIGPNGAGKTTTIRALCGIIRPSGGSLRVAGYDVEREAQKVKQHVAYVPDDPPLFETLTVWEHLQFIASAYDVADFRSIGESLLDEFKLGHKRHALASELSRGMRQKVAIACAYLHSPQVLFFDEPLTGLDPAAIRLLKRTMLEKAEAGATVLVSSHLLALVEDICRHLIVLRKGQCLFSGTIDQARAEHPDTNSLEDVFFRITEED